MNTVQQQLQALGPTFTVDGVEWLVGENSAKIFSISTEIKPISIDIWPPMTTDFGKEIKHYRAYIKGFGIDAAVIRLKATIPADACFEAIRLCRERIAELGKALGMGMYDDEPSGAGLRNHLLKHPDMGKVEDACRHRLGVGVSPTRADINTSAEIAANIESHSVQGLAELYFRKGANYVLKFNQPTGEKEEKNEL